jgi:N-sulfoglucosamine sulfohydrolase
MNLNRRDFLKSTMGAGALAAVSPVLAKEKTEAPKPAKAPATELRPTLRPMAERPNILYIIMEDCGPNYGCYGEPLVQTPQVDQLAAQGVRYTNAFTTCPVCSPSRSALMTGCYQTFTGSHHHRTWAARKQELPVPAAHLCDWFRAAGYYTCNLQPAQKNKGKGPRAKLNGPLGSGKIDLNFVVNQPKPGNPFDGYDWTQRAAGQPFFAHITIMETHKGEGWTVAREQSKAELVDPEKLRLPPYYPDHPVARDEYANYLDAIHLCDGYLGQLLARLKQEGLAENTIVILSSDHGPLFRGKQFLYDNGLRIPLVVRYPDGRRAGTVDDQLISGVDLAPMLLGLAGIEPPAGAMQGQDFLAAESTPRAHVYAARDRMDTSVDRMRSVRSARYKYIRNYLPAVPYMQANAYKEKNYPTWNLVKEQAKAGTIRPPEAALFAAAIKPIEELYDLAADPHEVRNLAEDPAHLAALREHRALLNTELAKYDRGTAYEDPLENYQGYWGRLPGDPETSKPDYNS